jgi:1,4-dihydroxy-6-naphthoate synthase
MTTIHLGISTCPNDTFAFHGLLTRSVDWRGLNFDVELIDIQQLNDRLFAGELDVAKTSFHAALMLAKETVVLAIRVCSGIWRRPAVAVGSRR